MLPRPQSANSERSPERGSRLLLKPRDESLAGAEAVFHEAIPCEGLRRRGGQRATRAAQPAAFFTSAAIFFSSAAVSSVRAKAVGQMAPLSRFAWSLKPRVAYLDLNLAALWKKHTTLPSFAYAGIPYQVRGERAGAVDLTIAWRR